MTLQRKPDAAFNIENIGKMLVNQGQAVPDGDGDDGEDALKPSDFDKYFEHLAGVVQPPVVEFVNDIFHIANLGKRERHVMICVENGEFQ